MSVIGLGIDLVEVSRIRALLEKSGDRFKDRVFTAGEIAYCDACADGLSARITYVSPRPEFTPPIIYSRDSRDRLVFMVEARPERPGRLMPGLPVDVEPLP